MDNKKNKKIHKNIYLLGFSSLFNDLSSEMITPILPLLITKFGGAGIAIGLIGGVREGFSNTLRFLFGYLSDKISNRKLFIYGGYATSSFFKIMLIFAGSWQMILSFVGLERIGKGMRTAPRDALISRSSPHQVGLSFGIHRALDTAGALFGSILSFLMLWQWNFDLKYIILFAGIVAVYSLPPLFWVQEKNSYQKTKNKKKNVTFSSAYKIFLVIASIYSFANLSYMFFMLKAQSTLTGATEITPIFLYILFNTSYTIFAAPLGAFSDLCGRWMSITMGYLLFTCVTFGFIFAQSITFFSLLFMLYGIAFATVKINHKAFVSDLSSKNLKATGLGIFEATTGIATLLAGVIVGALWEHINHEAALYYASLLSLFAVILLLVFKKHLDKPEKYMVIETLDLEDK